MRSCCSGQACDEAPARRYSSRAWQPVGEPGRAGVTFENVSMRMKILSLELLDGLLKTAGPVFKSSERCIFAVKQYLCMSLVQVTNLPPLLLVTAHTHVGGGQNSISAVPAIFKLIIRIFDTLLHHFKQNLKAEVCGQHQLNSCRVCRCC